MKEPDRLCWLYQGLLCSPLARWGDFNEILTTSKKFGGNNIIFNRTGSFWDCINKCNLLDLGFKGSKYTWTNKRYKHRRHLILERLDRCLANETWLHLFPETSVSHMARTHSDRCPLLVNILKTPLPLINLFGWNQCDAPTLILSILSETLSLTTNPSLKILGTLNSRLNTGIGPLLVTSSTKRLRS